MRSGEGSEILEKLDKVRKHLFEGIRMLVKSKDVAQVVRKKQRYMLDICIVFLPGTFADSDLQHRDCKANELKRLKAHKPSQW